MSNFKGLPRKIKVAGKRYDVKYVKDLRGPNDSQCYGVHRPVEQEIVFDPVTDKDALGHVFHELLHALNTQLLPELGGKQEELLVQKLSHGLAGLFMDNPSLAWWFYRRARESR